MKMVLAVLVLGLVLGACSSDPNAAAIEQAESEWQSYRARCTTQGCLDILDAVGTAAPVREQCDILLATDGDAPASEIPEEWQTALLELNERKDEAFSQFYREGSAEPPSDSYIEAARLWLEYVDWLADESDCGAE